MVVLFNKKNIFKIKINLDRDTLFFRGRYLNATILLCWPYDNILYLGSATLKDRDP